LVIIAIVLIGIVGLTRTVRAVPQQRRDVVERLRKYNRTLDPGLNLLVPFVDTIRAKVDMREQVVTFPPQPVITSDNLNVLIDTVLYYRVVDPVRATYEIANFLYAVEQLVGTTLRNVIGNFDLERALTSRDEINHHLSGVLDETTGRWGIKVTRVEIKAIEPPPSIRDSMEKQMRAERDRRAAILTAEGVKQSQILTAQGEQQAAILRAEGDRQARILQADGQAKAIRTVVDAITVANPSAKVLAYQYLQTLPQIANGASNKLWILPAELTKAMEGIGGALGRMGNLGSDDEPSIAERPIESIERAPEEPAGVAADAAAAAAAAAKEAEEAVREAVATSGVAPVPATKPKAPELPAAPGTPASEAVRVPADHREHA
jgi:regulator of protease activity HflC (stomatin/prohibitin superfamily)